MNGYKKTPCNIQYACFSITSLHELYCGMMLHLAIVNILLPILNEKPVFSRNYANSDPLVTHFSRLEREAERRKP